MTKLTKCLAKLNGKVITELPTDLYIPPKALKVFLDAFEGPLDLLLYLIKKNNLNIVDIPVAEITRQYIEYVDLMREFDVEMIAQYLLMAAMLVEIKTQMLLPTLPLPLEQEEDPRAQLIARLQEYERFKKAADHLNALPLLGRDTFLATASLPNWPLVSPRPALQCQSLFLALKAVIVRANCGQPHRVKRELLSVRERMSWVMQALLPQRLVPFYALLTYREGKRGVVVTFIAILELLKTKAITLTQTDSFAPIYLQMMEK